MSFCLWFVILIFVRAKVGVFNQSASLKIVAENNFGLFDMGVTGEERRSSWREEGEVFRWAFGRSSEGLRREYVFLTYFSHKGMALQCRLEWQGQCVEYGCLMGRLYVIINSREIFMVEYL